MKFFCDVKLALFASSILLCYVFLVSVASANNDALLLGPSDVEKYWIEYDGFRNPCNQTPRDDGPILDCWRPLLYLPEAVRANVSACFGFSYRITSEGGLSDMKILRSNLSKGVTDEMRKRFEQRIVFMLQRDERFVPTAANSNRREVRSYKVYSFKAPGSQVSTDELARPCRLPESSAQQGKSGPPSDH